MAEIVFEGDLKMITDRGEIFNNTDFNGSSFFDIVSGIDRSSQEVLKHEIIESLNVGDEQDICSLSFGTLAFVLWALCNGKQSVFCGNLLAYGAGNMAEKYLKFFVDKIGILEIWDKYSEKKEIIGVSVNRPYSKDYKNIPVIVFIDDEIVRKEVTVSFLERGYSELFYFRDYKEIIRGFEIIDQCKLKVTERTLEILKKLLGEYMCLESTHVPVLFSVIHIPKDNYVQRICRDLSVEKITKEIRSCLVEKKLIDTDISEAVNDLCEWIKSHQLLDVMIGFEKSLQRILKNRPKTKYRWIKMINDYPYDEFSVYETLKILLMNVCEEDSEAIIDLLEKMRNSTGPNIILIAIECDYLLDIYRCLDALHLAREGMVIDSNDLLANETFYKVAKVCKLNNIEVLEPIPEYDLKERFC
mgnify:CR=1 FL=1